MNQNMSSLDKSKPVVSSFSLDPQLRFINKFGAEIDAMSIVDAMCAGSGESGVTNKRGALMGKNVFTGTGCRTTLLSKFIQ